MLCLKVIWISIFGPTFKTIMKLAFYAEFKENLIIWAIDIRKDKKIFSRRKFRKLFFFSFIRAFNKKPNPLTSLEIERIDFAFWNWIGMYYFMSTISCEKTNFALSSLQKHFNFKQKHDFWMIVDFFNVDTPV